MDKITFCPDGESPVDFYVLEETRIGGKSYILVTDTEEGDGEALILRDDSSSADEEGLYTVVQDDKELSSVAPIFRALLEEAEIGLEE